MINREILRAVIQEQHAPRLPEPLIVRELSFDTQTLKQSSAVVVLMGIRRSGKSTWLQQLRSSATERDYYLNFDDDRLVSFELSDFQVMLELFVELYGDQRTCYFDEIQNIPEWERFIRRLHDQGYKVYITGSNATMFSRELGSRLTGRYLKYEIFPFSFLEYLKFKDYEYSLNLKTTKMIAELQRYYREYSQSGGFVEYLRHGELRYLQDLYENVLYRDIIVRYKLPSPRAIMLLTHYLASNAGKLITYNSLKKMLFLSSANTVSDYCSYLSDAYLCFFVNAYHDSLKKQGFLPKKVYLIDNGLAKAVGFRRSDDHGPFLENAVFLALIRMGYKIFYHKDRYECDFVVQEFNKTVCVIQVCFDMSDAKTREREIRGLQEAMQAHKLKSGLIVTGNHREDLEAISIIPVTEFLLTHELLLRTKRK